MVEAERDTIQHWFFERLTVRLAAVFEAMTGERPVVQWDSAAGAPDGPGLRWHQSFLGGRVNRQAGIWIVASEKDWTEAGRQVLRAAGIDEVDGATLKSTYIEILGQALSGVSQDLSGRVGYEVTCGSGEDFSAQAGVGRWARLRIQFASAAADLAAGIEQELLDSLVDGPPLLTANAAAAAETAGNSKTFELLLDVELPVSVSFGRAQLPLKDVIKITSGSIIELNRSIGEPVEVIVNNCVIARGEVVVVEGNFGVRIQEVISRQERLRSLN
jgi:flagellar motor switch protein FliN/FliY